MSYTINPIAAEKLNTDLVNGFKSRNSGYTRVIKTGKRLGDGAEMAVIEIILDEDYTAADSNKPEPKKSKPKKTEPKKIAKVKKDTPKPKVTKKEGKK